MSPPIPHSGDHCSGMCSTPCDHWDCWQCRECKLAQGLNTVSIVRSADMRLASLQGMKTGVLASTGRLPSSKEGEKTIITRAALEALCEKAGVPMDWNSGNPIMSDDGLGEYAEKWTATERERIKEKVKLLEDIARQQSGGMISQQVANDIAKDAAMTSDKMTSDVLRAKVRQTLAEDLQANEVRVKGKLKTEGATDEDIAAAEALFGWKPPTSAYIEGPSPARVAAVDVAGMRRLVGENVGFDGYIIHPSLYKELMGELDKP